MQLLWKAWVFLRNKGLTVAQIAVRWGFDSVVEMGRAVEASRDKKM